MEYKHKCPDCPSLKFQIVKVGDYYRGQCKMCRACTKLCSNPKEVKEELRDGFIYVGGEHK